MPDTTVLPDASRGRWEFRQWVYQQWPPIQIGPCVCFVCWNRIILSSQDWPWTCYKVEPGFSLRVLLPPYWALEFQVDLAMSAVAQLLSKSSLEHPGKNVSSCYITILSWGHVIVVWCIHSPSSLGDRTTVGSKKCTGTASCHPLDRCYILSEDFSRFQNWEAFLQRRYEWSPLTNCSSIHC